MLALAARSRFYLPLSHFRRGSSITTTGAFAFHGAYPEASVFSVDMSKSEQADLDIDSGASDADH